MISTLLFANDSSRFCSSSSSQRKMVQTNVGLGLFDSLLARPAVAYERTSPAAALVFKTRLSHEPRHQLAGFQCPPPLPRRHEEANMWRPPQGFATEQWHQLISYILYIICAVDIQFNEKPYSTNSSLQRSRKKHLNQFEVPRTNFRSSMGTPKHVKLQLVDVWMDRLAPTSFDVNDAILASHTSLKFSLFSHNYNYFRDSQQ